MLFSSMWNPRAFRLVVGAGMLMLASGCSVPHLADFVPQKGDERPFEKPLEVNRRHNILAIGWDAVVGVKEDGTVWVWGSATRGQFGNGKQSSSSSVPVKIEGLEDIVEVAGTDMHFLALKKDGTVWSWGNNDRGQLGYRTGKEDFSSIPREIPDLKEIISVAAGAHSLALDSNGNVWAFGSNANMALGISPQDTISHYKPEVVFKESSASKVVANAGISGVLTNQGEFYYWGSNGFMGNRMEENLPKKYNINFRIVDVSISNAVYFLSSDGYVWAQAGRNLGGQLGQGDFNDYGHPVKVKNIGRIISVASRYLSGLALDERGRVWQWGSGVRFRNIPELREGYESYPVLIGAFDNAISIMSQSASAAIAGDGKVYFWGVDEGRRGTAKPKYNQRSENSWSVPEMSQWMWK